MCSLTWFSSRSCSCPPPGLRGQGTWRTAPPGPSHHAFPRESASPTEAARGFAEGGRGTPVGLHPILNRTGRTLGGHRQAARGRRRRQLHSELLCAGWPAKPMVMFMYVYLGADYVLLSGRAASAQRVPERTEERGAESAAASAASRRWLRSAMSRVRVHAAGVPHPPWRNPCAGLGRRRLASGAERHGAGAPAGLQNR